MINSWLHAGNTSPWTFMSATFACPARKNTETYLTLTDFFSKNILSLGSFDFSMLIQYRLIYTRHMFHLLVIVEIYMTWFALLHLSGH